MATKTHYQVKARLTAEEYQMLLHCCTPGNGATQHNPSELIRLWIHREYAKRTRKRNRENWSAIRDAAFATDWRRGRPKVTEVQKG